MKFTTHFRSLSCIVLLAAGLAGPALAQSGAGTYPSKAIRLVVPYAPGGGTDLVMRAIAPGMAETLGQPVVVENRPGGGTINATEIVVRGAADGYTLLAVGAPIYLNTALGIKTPYDPLKDLTPLSLLVNNPGLLLVSSKVPAKNVQELVALSKSRPSGLSYASAGTGSIGHLGGELLKAKLGLNMLHIPYKGSAPALADLMGGQVELAIDAMIPSGTQVKAGKVRALAILTNQRSPLLPDVPTLAEAGYPGLEFGATFGLMLPANTPPAIVNRLHAAMMQAINQPATRKQLVEMGYEIVANTPAQFGTYLRQQIDAWTKIVKDNHITVD
ncbi:Bug family tripartite tricarboxylate transporter substrate binding protein [Ottowia thiooxydans]|uniref:Bug family tripartite tricarboxylate transporter substrate binding protein n=1 Tax=Ottowia thiooxydans TaxID=219182 RepID=UPI0003F84FAE|nr:tripartite tricarboxylate transporter substrate binding protein [Ottowia thiooxydans]